MSQVIHEKLLQCFRKRLKIDVSYFAFGSFYSLIQQSVGVICGLIVSYLFGHFVSKVVFGEYNLVLSYLSMFMFFSLPGIDTALTKSLGNGHDRSLIDAFRYKIKFSLLGTLALGGLGLYYVSRNNVNLSFGLFIGALLFPFYYSFPLFTTFLTIKQRFDRLAIIASLSSVFFLLALIGSIFWWPTTFGITLIFLLANIIPASLGFMYSVHLLKSSSSVDPHLFNYGSFLTLVSIIPWISGNIGSIILASKLGVETLAIYSVAVDFLVAVQKNFIVFYKPIKAKLAQQSKTQHLETLSTHATKFLLMGLTMCVLLWFILPVLIRFFFPLYPESIFPAQLLSLALIPMPLSWILNDMIVFQKKQTVNVLVSTIPQLVKLIFFFILIPRFGIYGLILSLLGERILTPIMELVFLLN